MVTLTDELDASLHYAAQMAFTLKHEQLLPEHLLLMLFMGKNADIEQIANVCNLDIKEVMISLNSLVQKIPTYRKDSINREFIRSSDTLNSILIKSGKIEKHGTIKKIGAFEFILAILEDRSLTVTKELKELGVDVAKIKELWKKTPNKEDLIFLRGFATCISDSHDSKDFTVIGRDDDIKKIALDLTKLEKRNVLLIGEPGIGKTALVTGLNQYIKSKKCPKSLHNCSIWKLDSKILTSEVNSRTEIEKRIKTIMSICEKNENIILFIENIQDIQQVISLEFLGVLEQYLERGIIKLICSTNEQDYTQTFSKNSMIKKFFICRIIKELPFETMFKIIRATATKLEHHHNITFSDDAIKTAMRLSKEHTPEMKLPKAALDFLDHAGSRLRSAKGEVSEEQVIKTLPSLLLDSTQIGVDTDKRVTDNLLHKLESSIFGQPQAIEKLYKAVIRAQAGLQHPERPLGGFLFVGPTGVGKTELAKQLAKHMNLPLVKFDLSEYQESHSISRLIGSPPGYVGHQEGGQLATSLSKHPSCVLLMDEFEKANPSIHKLFLQALSDGTITDSKGQVIDFRKVILIFTTNLGSETLEKRVIGFNAKSETSFDPTNAIKTSLSPEFRNRLTGIIPFSPLSDNDKLQVVRKNLDEFKAFIADKIKLEYSNSFVVQVSKLSFDPLMGARPIERWIEEYIKTPLAEVILSNDFINGGTYNMKWDKKNSEVKFNKPSTKCKK